MKKKETKIWIPLYVDKWIFGSTRHELDPAERSVWIDLLTLAAKDDGFIRANVDTPYPETQLAGMLVVPLDLLHRTIEKCLTPTIGKLILLENGTLYVVNWKEYQFTSRYRRMIDSEPPVPPRETSTDKSSSAKTEEHFRSSERIEQNRTEQNIIKQKIEEVVTLWNKFARRIGIPWIRDIEKGSTRERHLLVRLNDPKWDLPKIIEAIEAQPFLTGDNDRGWLVSFDWILNSSNYSKILEGVYTKVRRGDAARRAPDDPRTGGRR
jgi:hypothetical protein